MTNISAYAEQVATHYWGKPSARRGHELRWGTHGSKSVDLRKGTWFDHENNEGGGVVDLVRREEGATIGTIPDILERKFGIAKRSQTNLKPAKYVAARYDYFNDDGELVYQVERYEPKTFRQRRPDGKGGWLYNMQGVEAQPYNLHGMIMNPKKTVFVVEGEKCADKLIALGAVATTAHGGAGNWKPEINRHFEGRKVVIVPDQDDAGDKHASVVINNLIGTAAEIRRVDLPGLTEKQDVYDWFENGGTIEQMRDLVTAAPVITETTPVEPDQDKPKADTFPLMSISDLMSMPPVKWLIDGVITSHGLSVLYGAPGVGKSFIAIDMALSIAYGREWHGSAVDEGLVLYIAGEGVGGLGKRVKAWQNHHKVGDKAAPFVVLPLAVQFREQADVEKLIATISTIEQPIRCIVIDTVARSMLGMEENSSTEIGIFVDACDTIKRMYGCAVLAIHHSGKDASRGMRGSNALLGAVDTSLMVKKTGDNIILNTEKQKDAEPIDDMAFALEQVALIGETSAVVQRVQKAPANPDGRKRLNANEQIAYDLFVELLSKSGQDFVFHKDWTDEHLSRYPDLSDKVRSTARTETAKKGYLINQNGKVYLINDLRPNLTEEDLF